MPLDLAALGSQLPRLGEYARLQAPAHAVQRELALETLRAHADEHDILAARAAGGGRRPFRAAIPREALDATHTAPPAPDAYSVVATDGSQIEPDRHGPVLCHLVNVGSALVEYGPNPRACLTSDSHLAFEDDEVYYHLPGREPMLVEDRLLSLRRHVGEMTRLADLAAGAIGDRPIVALQDGTLLLSAWGQGGETAVLQPILEDFLAALDTLRERGIAVASYISRPRGSDVVNLLRLALCAWPDLACEATTCAGKPATATGCGALAGLPDREVFGPILARPGDRSAVFESSWAASREHYGEHRIDFFYLNVGSEIARVEVPRWVAADPAALDLVQTVLLDQCARGDGYPRALIEAHEKAVIGAGDRRLYEALLERALVGTGARFESSAKERSKRLRSL